MIPNDYTPPEQGSENALSGHNASGRIHFLDELRGFTIILMVAYHAFFTAGWIFGHEWGQMLFLFFMPSVPLFAGTFVVLCGVSCRLSHNNAARGLKLAGAAVVVSLVMWFFMRDEMIWFGILHFLAVAILIFVPLRKLLDVVPPAAGIAACALLTLVTAWVPSEGGGVFGIPGLLSFPVPAALTSMTWLYPLGFSYLQSSDYFPLIPWLFPFLGGTFIGVWAKNHQLPRWMSKSHVPPLSFIGRMTFVIYVVHQPVIFALFWLINQGVGK